MLFGQPIALRAPRHSAAHAPPPLHGSSSRWRAAYVWLLGNIPYIALASAVHDDTLFVHLASYILRGQWLGPYDNLTLAKGPFFPLWIAGAWVLHLPLLASEALLYAVAGLLFWSSMQRHFRVSWGIIPCFALLLLNPMVWQAEQLRVMREGLYGPLTVLVLALVARCFGHPDLRPGQRQAAGLALGLALGCFWITREEGIWILPSVLVLWLGLFGATSGSLELFSGRMGRMFSRTVPILGATAAVIAGWLMIYAGVVSLNRHVYGVANTVEFKQSEFLSAYGALTRVEPEARRPKVPVPAATLQKIAAASPSLASLMPALEEQRDLWARLGCTVYAVSPCDREWRGGWFMWALRAAVADRGYYSSAEASRAFYRQLADEVNLACLDGRLTCGPLRATIVPAFRADDLRPLWVALMSSVRMLVAFPGDADAEVSSGSPFYLQVFTDLVGGPHFPTGPERVLQTNVFTPGPVTSIAVSGDLADASTVEARPLTGETHGDRNRLVTRLYVLTGCTGANCRLNVTWDGGMTSFSLPELAKLGSSVGADGIGFETSLALDSRTDAVSPTIARGRRLLEALRPVDRLYRRAMPVVALLALASLGWQVVVAALRRRADFVLLMEVALLGGILGRLVLLSYLDVSLMPGINTLYLTPLYPMLLLFIGLALWRSTEQLWAWLLPQRRMLER